MGLRGGLCGAGFLVRIDIVGMAGVRTIMGDGLRRFVRVLERTPAILPAGMPPEVVIWLIGRGDNPKAGKMGLQREESMRRDGPLPA